MVILNQIPDLKHFMEKEVLVITKFGYKCKGIMRGFDHFLNIILEVKIKSKNDHLSEIMVKKIKIDVKRKLDYYS
uniref:mRNA splicing factor snRNPG n=1 Tax=Lotharella vacuolata TaxID=74820 RepID=A0A0H5BL24_9EUKA|nr:mRNA splicing factor snRNPG [Lotharella vacuolata]